VATCLRTNGSCRWTDRRYVIAYPLKLSILRLLLTTELARPPPLSFLDSLNTPRPGTVAGVRPTPGGMVAERSFPHRAYDDFELPTAPTATVDAQPPRCAAISRRAQSGMTIPRQGFGF
jgi:hypothetical protein